MSTKYIRLCKNIYDKGVLIKEEELADKINSEKEFYTSTYFYNEKHLEQFKKTGSVKGITDVTTNKIWFDFDNETNPENSRTDAIEVVNRLNKHNIKDENIEVYFSGNKGYNLVVNLKKELTPKQVSNVCKSIGKGISTLDLSLYDAVQILRVPATKHPKSELYKIPLTVKQLKTLSHEQVKKLAKSLDNITEDFSWESVDLKEDLLKQEEALEINVSKKDPTLNELLATKPRDWKDYKWALLNAVQVKPDERHAALMRIAATARGLGYGEELTKAFCLTFDEKFCKITGKQPVQDLETNIIPSVFSPTWNGGQYSIKNDVWLQSYCERIGLKPNDLKMEDTITIDEAYDLFKDYAENIDQTTIKSGINQIDKRLRMTIGMSVAVVAAPGVGKTTLALSILNSMSNRDEQSIFFSYDMYHALVFQKLVQKHLKVSDEYIFEKFKNKDLDFQEKALNVLRTEYKNVEFCFNVGQKPDDIEETIKRVEEKTGKKVRLIIVDYNELVMSDYSDPTQSTAFVAQKLNQIAKLHNVCVITLVQPNKMAGTPSDEIKSYRSMKGSSALEQSFSVVMGMWRPGYDPRYPQDDQFVTINCLKNRMGSLFTLDLGWSGSRGEIYELTDEQKAHLEQIRARKMQEKEDTGGWD